MVFIVYMHLMDGSHFEWHISLANIVRSRIKPNAPLAVLGGDQ